MLIFLPHSKGFQSVVGLDDKQSQDCTVSAIADGDTITCNGGLKIRFCGIDAPESSQPLGNESRQKLIDFLANREVIISPIERDRYGRLIAEVFVKISQGSEEELFINAEMVRAGLAYHYDRYSGSCLGKDAIVDAEIEARGRSIGVWSGNYQRPWDFRQERRSALPSQRESN